MVQQLFSHIVAAIVAITGMPPGPSAPRAPGVTTHIDSALHEVIISVTPLHLAGGTTYEHMHDETKLPFAWPVGGWVRGYRIDVVDSAGRLLPRGFLHHAGVANLGRRELPYPVAERLIAAGRETPPLMLPESMGIPLPAGQRLVLYYMLVNPGADDIDGASLRITVAWTPEGGRAPQSVFPMFLDANPVRESRTFDLPVGRTTTSAEVTLAVSGYLRALGGHAHDHAVELRLEDAATNEVLARLTTKRDPEGRLLSITTDRFLFKRRGLHLAANHPYRVVSIYDNPTCQTIPAGAMAFMIGPFSPDDAARWPAVDPDDPEYRRDYAELVAPARAAAVGMGGMESMEKMAHTAAVTTAPAACRPTPGTR